MDEKTTVETAVALARIEGKIDLQTNEMTHLRQGMADHKIEVADLRKELDRKADKAEFKALWGHITKGVWIVLGAVITALVAMVVKTHAG